ncbi:putative ABC transport system permease protein [Nakamurella sp. UYEF19]|uniref:ABC transporter permease n=1 Tax=Nakamurella sp. UYEF19 TaxID=1756392 RepID=UPI0033938AB0
MLHATLKSLLAQKLRMAMSTFAIILGVAFVSGSFVFTDTMSNSFGDIFRQTAPDVTVRPAHAQAASAGGFTGADTRPIPAALVTTLAALPGVSLAGGVVSDQSTFVIGKNGKVVGSGGGAPGIGDNYDSGPAADGSAIVTITSGTAPAGPGQVLLDDKTAATAGYALGDTVHLVTSGRQPSVTATLVGTVRFGRSGNLVGATLVLMDTPTAQRLYLGGADAFNSVAVTGDGSLTNQQLSDEVTAALPAGFEAVDDEQIAAENQTAIAQSLSFSSTFLLIFAAISLVVGTFLILNTFSIIVAQRTKELALFRALGASRRQVTRSVLVEALVVGLVGSTVGLLLGFVLALGLKALFGAIGLDLSQAGLVLQWRTVAVAYAVGVLVTLLAAYVPARRAGTVPPIAAMQDNAVLPESSMKLRMLAGGLLTAVGAALMVWAFLAGGSIPLLGGGVLAVFLGVVMLGPVIGRPLVTAIASPFPRLFGTVGVLARQNARRNPRRTAATASALMIGLALISAMAVLGQSTKSSVDESLRTDLTADYVVSNATPAPFSATIGPRIAAVPGVADVVGFRVTVAGVNGVQGNVSSFDPTALRKVVALTVKSGDLDIGDNGVLVTSTRAETEGWKVGDTLIIGLPAGPRTMPIVGILAPTRFLGADVVLPPAALRTGGITAADTLLFLTRTPGADTVTVTAGINRVLADLPTVTLQDQNAFAATTRASIDQIIAIIYALLGLAVIIAVLGIVNTLALSMVERTREIGLLRAVGMSRRQLRSMIRLESVAIAVLGAVLGIGLGLIFGISLQRSLSGQGIQVLSIPVAQLLAFVVLAAIVGVLAAVLPARRAARMGVLRAITTQ